MSRLPGMYRSKRALYVLAAIPDDAPPHLKKALAIRNACATQLRCPDCGAEPKLRAHPDSDRFFHASFHHEPGCRGRLDGEVAA